MIQQVTDGIWTVPAPLTYCGLLLNTRMTVCRLADQGLALISPIQSSPELLASIDALGPVRAIITSNLMHHLYAGEWIEAYPDALSYGPVGIAAKRADLTFTHELGTASEPAFDQALGSDLRRLPIAGMPTLNESLFLHRPSATLITTDFCFFLPEATGLTGLFAAVTGVKHKTRCEPSFRLMVKDKAAFRASLQPLRAIPIRHLSMCHHSVLSVDATETLRQVLDQLKVPVTTEPDG